MSYATLPKTKSGAHATLGLGNGAKKYSLQPQHFQKYTNSLEKRQLSYFNVGQNALLPELNTRNHGPQLASLKPNLYNGLSHNTINRASSSKRNAAGLSSTGANHGMTPNAAADAIIEAASYSGI